MLMKPYQFETHELVFQSPDRARPSLITQLILKLEAYVEHRRQRRALLALNEHLLKDIGLSRGDAERIARQPFSWLGKHTTLAR